jgi:DNA-binding CsgD family transcriptional regulator
VGVAPRGSERAGALWRLARVHVFEADHRTALAVYHKALGEAGDDVEVKLRAEAGVAVAMMRMLEDLPSAARHARTAVTLAEANGLPHLLPDYLATQALIEGLLGRPEAVAIARRAAALDERLSAVGTSAAGSFLRGLNDARFMLGVILHWSDDLAGARDQIDAALDISAEIGDEGSVPLLLRYRATTGWLTGDWEQALGDAVEGYEIALQTGQPSQQAVLGGTRGLLLAHLGHIDEARAAAEHALDTSAKTGAMFGTMLATSALGFLELSVGNPLEADRRLGPLVERLESAGIREPGAVRFVPDEIEALIALGRVEEAEALLSRLEERARRLDRPSALAAAGRARGLLGTALGRHEDGLAALESALVEHDRARMPFERARTLLARGSLERRAKQKRAARESLQEALRIFEQLGARLWIERARAELARIGGRAPSSGELTPTEERVAELVAEGRATKEVASLLFVSPKTVEGHLSRIYAKLDVHSRTELAARIHSRPVG